MPATHSVGPDSMHYQTVVPWTMYSEMTERDLEAVYTYLHTLTPVKNKVTKFTPH